MTERERLKLLLKNSKNNIRDKKCSTCGEWKIKSDYHKDNSNSDKLCSSCKECEKGRKEYKKGYRKENGEEINRKKREKYKNDPEYREENKRKAREYYNKKTKGEK